MARSCRQGAVARAYARRREMIGHRVVVAAGVMALGVRGKPGCTDVLEGCCRTGTDCDRIPFMSMMAGLQCLSPTPAQCHEMMVECMCPVNGEEIDSWEDPCERQPAAAGGFMFDHITQRCLTCDQYLAQLPLDASDAADPTAAELTGPYAPGDFPCRLGGPDGDRMEIDCTSIISITEAGEPGVNVGAVSGVPCPYAAVAIEPASAPEPEPEQLPDCGEHGSFSEGHCVCDTAEDPDTGETLKCWQTNRERSNRHPNGNIISWCTIGMCNFDEAGNAVLASGAQGSNGTPDQKMSIVADLAKAFGVSPTVVVAAGLLVVVTSCWLMCSGSPKQGRGGEESGRRRGEYEMDDVAGLPIVIGRPAETHNPLLNRGSGGGGGGSGARRGREMSSVGGGVQRPRGQDGGSAERQRGMQRERSHEESAEIEV